MAKDYFSPFEEMHNYYAMDKPTPEVEFRFVEAMECIIAEDHDLDSINREMALYNLAMYYKQMHRFALAREYLEKGLALNRRFFQEALEELYELGD